MVKDNHNKFIQFRNTYTYFVYEGFNISDTKDALSVVYNFNLADKFFFKPHLEIPKNSYLTGQLSLEEMQNFVFHIGMVELISYWKAACPPKIIIKPYMLDDFQINWWKHLYFNGLGEFFYRNNISADEETFVSIISASEHKLHSLQLNLDNSKALIPVGGGKDSVVTMELLKGSFDCLPFILNPRQASIETIIAAGFQSNEYVEVRRTIHAQLLDLNAKGYLNGHTPFSALLAFVCVFAAALSGIKHVVLSNESSANEPTDKLTGVNHQYSKSFYFERDFRDYIAMYISPQINYFSFLRPLNEYQIAGIFSDFPHQFKAFRSCNAGSKTNSWCGNCPKCLFAYIILSPFLSRDRLLDIFGTDLFEKKSLLPTFKELIGRSETKPFECVGTVNEINFALTKTIKKYDLPYPFLLDYYNSLPGKIIKPEIFRLDVNLTDHFVDKNFYKILESAVK